MSAMNDALSSLSNRNNTDSSDHLKPAKVAKVRSTAPWIWVGVGFTLSIGVGSWAVSQQNTQIIQSSHEAQISSQAVAVDHIETTLPVRKVKAEGLAVNVSEQSVPTNRVTEQDIALYESSTRTKKSDVVNASEASIVTAAATETVTAATTQVNTQPTTSSKVATQPSDTKRTTSNSAAPVLLAQVSSPTNNSSLQKNSDDTPKAKGVISIEKVELTPSQLASKAVVRAEKAIDSNELNEAIEHYQKALRYTPKDELIRQKLAALYYGKQDSRKALELLQEGIRLNNDSERLRLNLSQLLLKEDQQQAALTPLAYLPPSPSIRYLSVRAALAQQQKQHDMARESYQALVELDPTNGRWWLGYGIQLERSVQFEKARDAYEQALKHVGISSQSQAFIMDRLSVLKQLEESADAN